MAKNKAAQISRAKSIDELGEFWDSHDATESEDQTHEVEMGFDLRVRGHCIAIDPELLARLREVAEQKGLTPESLANLWLQERIIATEN
jgi:hypothetical protein